jgi:hypothetical protein
VTIWRSIVLLVGVAILSAYYVLETDLGLVLGGRFWSIECWIVRACGAEPWTLTPWPLWPRCVARAIGMLPVVIASVTAYHLLTRANQRRPSNCECLCRKCGYILRGISEPRCPECGERI